MGTNAARYHQIAHAAGCPRDQMRNFARAGIVLQPQQLKASAAARLCDAEVLRRLGAPDATPPKPPTILIHPRCARLLDCLPSLMHDEDRPEDVEKVDAGEVGLGGDGYYDGFRYGLKHAARDSRAVWGPSPFGDRRW